MAWRRKHAMQSAACGAAFLAAACGGLAEGGVPTDDECVAAECAPVAGKAQLSGLTVSSGTLTPEFQAQQREYRLDIDDSFDLTVDVASPEQVQIVYAGKRV